MLFLSMSLRTKCEGLGEGPTEEFCPPPPPVAPPPVENSGTEGRAGEDYVSSKLALCPSLLGAAGSLCMHVVMPALRHGPVRAPAGPACDEALEGVDPPRIHCMGCTRV